MIRKATLKDVDAIHSLLQQIASQHHSLYPDRFKNQTKYSKKQISKLLEDHEWIIRVFDNGTVKGYIFARIYLTYLYIDDLCVDEASQNQSIGKSLISDIYDIAKSLELQEIQLNVWDNNEKAKSFYDRLGYAPLRTIRSKKVE